MKQSVTILDVDGTLCDVRPALHHLLGVTKNKDGFIHATLDCPPHEYALTYARHHYARGQHLVVCSSRREKYRPQTEVWLKKHLNVPYEQLILDPTGPEAHTTDVEAKQWMLTKIRENYTPTHAIDDTIEIIELWRANGIKTTTMPLLRRLTGEYPILKHEYENAQKRKQ